MAIEDRREELRKEPAPFRYKGYGGKERTVTTQERIKMDAREQRVKGRQIVKDTQDGLPEEVVAARAENAHYRDGGEPTVQSDIFDKQSIKRRSKLAEGQKFSGR